VSLSLRREVDLHRTEKLDANDDDNFVEHLQSSGFLSDEAFSWKASLLVKREVIGASVIVDVKGFDLDVVYNGRGMTE
jgi:hypothetical protein